MTAFHIKTAPEYMLKIKILIIDIFKRQDIHSKPMLRSTYMYIHIFYAFLSTTQYLCNCFNIGKTQNPLIYIYVDNIKSC